MPPMLAGLRRACAITLALLASAPSLVAAPADWPAGLLPMDRSPVDLSFLNAGERPAGQRGFVRADGERLVFEDGTPARFWGTNLVASAIFGTPRDEVPRQARRLSALGYNLVRLVHHDSIWVRPNIFGPAPAVGPATIDPDMMDRIDWWAYHLRAEGIHLWLDLHVGRRLRSDEGIHHFDEIADKGSALMNGYSYVNASMQKAMQDFNRAYLGHRNRYTGLRYLDDPAVVGVMLTNENDITHHFGNLLVPGRRTAPRHAGLFLEEARQFARTRSVPLARVLRTWEHGPSKLFLNDLEYRVSNRMLDELRDLGLRAPAVSTNQWGNNPTSSLPALTAGELIDAHAYGHAGELRRDPSLEPTLVHWLAAARLAGRPMTVTEWNMGERIEPDRHTLPLYVAASAGHQGWDAVMHYAYVQEPLGGPGTPSVWHGYNDPGIQALMPAAALLFRRGDVRRALSTYVHAPPPEALFGQEVSAANATALRTAAERGRLVIALPHTPELPWLMPSAGPADAHRIQDPHVSLLAPGATSVTSDHGELSRDWKEGRFAVDTPRSQVVSGALGGRTLELTDVTVRLDTAVATVAVQSLDDAPIHASRDILISMVADARPGPGDAMPFRSEPVRGRVSVRAAPGMTVQAGDPVTGDERAVPFVHRDGRYVLDLNLIAPTHWLRLR